MLFPFDEEYIATKEIMLGKAEMNPDFIELANFIKNTYGVMPINIIYDTLDNGKRPRLGICLELEKELDLFFNIKQGYNEYEQKAVADKFTEIVDAGRTRNSTTHPGFEDYGTNRVFVYFSAFEPVAQMEFNEGIPVSEVAKLRERLGNMDLWEIMPKFNGVTFFVYTDVQVKHYYESPEPEKWRDAYFLLLEKNDIFGYYRKEHFGIFLDSKENFDNNYDGDWFNYFK